ncbi:MAG: hypothetical protein HY903_02425 [Deltaproteobacteria bacterium]|nr:hypothetical protein [Deltaproteobacteria bacterium]
MTRWTWTLCAALSSSSACVGGGEAGSGGGADGCGTGPACEAGKTCVDGTCRQPCTADSSCIKAESCTADQYCAKVNNDCSADSDCQSLVVCRSAYCEGGTCHQTPIWPEGAATAQPVCPLPGEDLDHDRERDADETWGGLCTHDGLCVACLTDNDCTPPHCECADAECTAKRCSQLQCNCEYNATGGASCSGAIARGFDDAEDGCGPTSSCNGLGACNSANGVLCLLNDECETRRCECSDPTCSAKRCSAAHCVCGFNLDGDATCDGNIGDGYDDANDACGSTLTCSGGGSCNLPNGTVCQIDAAYLCESNLCECQGVGCATSACSDRPCPCQYTNDGVGTCDGPITDGLDDAADRCGALTCDGAGHCHLPNNVTCTDDSQCESQHCECAGPDCSTKTCSNAPCGCKYNLDGNDSCDGNVADGKDDAHDSCGLLTCNGQGACNMPNGETCTVALANLCESNRCECGDSTCTAKYCSAATPAACKCKFNADGDATCEGVVDRKVDDAYNACGSASCDSNGGCLLGIGVDCTADTSCDSGFCECTSAACVTRVCSPESCVCLANSGPGLTCGSAPVAAIPKYNPDPEDCDGPGACNGSGVCLKANDQRCTVSAECASDCCQYRYVGGWGNWCTTSTSSCL